MEHELIWNIVLHPVFNPDWSKMMSQEMVPKRTTKTLASKITQEFSLNKIQTNDKFAVMTAAYSRPDDANDTI